MAVTVVDHWRKVMSLLGGRPETNLRVPSLAAQRVNPRYVHMPHQSHNGPSRKNTETTLVTRDSNSRRSCDSEKGSITTTKDRGGREAQGGDFLTLKGVQVRRELEAKGCKIERPRNETQPEADQSDWKVEDSHLKITCKWSHQVWSYVSSDLLEICKMIFSEIQQPLGG